MFGVRVAAVAQITFVRVVATIALRVFGSFQLMNKWTDAIVAADRTTAARATV